MLSRYKGMLSVYRGYAKDAHKTRGIKENTQPFTENTRRVCFAVYAAWYLKNKDKENYHDYCSDFLRSS